MDTECLGRPLYFLSENLPARLVIPSAIQGLTTVSFMEKSYCVQGEGLLLVVSVP